MIKFADLAGENLDFALPLLGAVAEPIKVDKQVVAGDAAELDTFAIAVAATVTLMFVTVLLVAGSLALEREENAFAAAHPRPRRPHRRCSPRRSVLGVVASLAVTLLLLAALTALFVTIDWGRIAADPGRDPRRRRRLRRLRRRDRRARRRRCGPARCSRSWSRCRSPSSRSSRRARSAPALFHVIEVVRALFPFDPALDAMQRRARLRAARGLGLPLARTSPRSLAARLRACARPALRCGASSRRDALARSGEPRPTGAPRISRVSFPATRMRRLRRTQALRDLVRETELSPRHLVQPLFVVAGEGVREQVESMPGVERFSITELVAEASELARGRESRR